MAWLIRSAPISRLDSSHPRHRQHLSLARTLASRAESEHEAAQLREVLTNVRGLASSKAMEADRLARELTVAKAAAARMAPAQPYQAPEEQDQELADGTNLMAEHQD